MHFDLCPFQTIDWVKCLWNTKHRFWFFKDTPQQILHNWKLSEIVSKTLGRESRKLRHTLVQIRIYRYFLKMLLLAINLWYLLQRKHCHSGWSTLIHASFSASRRLVGVLSQLLLPGGQQYCVLSGWSEFQPACLPFYGHILCVEWVYHKISEMSPQCKPMICTGVSCR